MSDRHESWAKVVMARLRETPCRYGFETADAAKIRRQMEREDGAVVIAQLLAEREALAAELAALKAQRDCELRKDLICAIWPEMLRIYDNSARIYDTSAPSGNNWDLVRINARSQALQDADAMIAAMRGVKEER